MLTMTYRLHGEVVLLVKHVPQLPALQARNVAKLACTREKKGQPGQMVYTMYVAIYTLAIPSDPLDSI